MSQWSVWKSAGHGVFSGCIILHINDHRNFYSTKKTPRCRTALQSIRISCASHHLYFDGFNVLYFVDNLQTAIHLARLYHYTVGYTSLLFSVEEEGELTLEFYLRSQN